MQEYSFLLLHVQTKATSGDIGIAAEVLFCLDLYNVSPFIFLHTSLGFSSPFLSGSLNLLDFLKG